MNLKRTGLLALATLTVSTAAVAGPGVGSSYYFTGCDESPFYLPRLTIWAPFACDATITLIDAYGEVEIPRSYGEDASEFIIIEDEVDGPFYGTVESTRPIVVTYSESNGSDNWFTSPATQLYTGYVITTNSSNNDDFVRLYSEAALDVTCSSGRGGVATEIRLEAGVPQQFNVEELIGYYDAYTLVLRASREFACSWAGIGNGWMFPQGFDLN